MTRKKARVVLLLASVLLAMSVVAGTFGLSDKLMPGIGMALEPFAKRVSRIGKPPGGRIEKSDDDWRRLLTPEQFRGRAPAGTERAFTGAYWNTKSAGVFQCVCCGQPLFDTKAKFDSGTGWPSFWEPVDENYISLLGDDSSFMSRTEVICSRCDAHLGHVFHDGPPPTGLRYCINSASMKFVAAEAKMNRMEPLSPSPYP